MHDLDFELLLVLKLTCVSPNLSMTPPAPAAPGVGTGFY